jgi:hypothetical protein
MRGSFSPRQSTDQLVRLNGKIQEEYVLPEAKYTGPISCTSFKDKNFNIAIIQNNSAARIFKEPKLKCGKNT